ncbi:GP4 [Guinea pig adenovirus 1]|uniref:GP4 n=1 Tax=Guinea pig adenovirus 1 TaxID=2847100 RepID=A0AC61M083_9ADEN|nr:GP4 [Guinea pig adenovirus]QIZ64163.1 GP4 [Guinea pig adenovirus 1]QIZ64195.1 GP4 [Guinea pig adenovirus]
MRVGSLQVHVFGVQGDLGRARGVAATQQGEIYLVVHRLTAVGTGGAGVGAVAGHGHDVAFQHTSGHGTHVALHRVVIHPSLVTDVGFGFETRLSAYGLTVGVHADLYTVLGVDVFRQKGRLCHHADLLLLVVHVGVHGVVGRALGRQTVVGRAAVGFEGGPAVDGAANVEVRAAHVQDAIVSHGQLKTGLIRILSVLPIHRHKPQLESLRAVGRDLLSGCHGGVTKLIAQMEITVGGAGELHQAGRQVVYRLLAGYVHVRPLWHHGRYRHGVGASDERGVGTASLKSLCVFFFLFFNTRAAAMNGKASTVQEHKDK